MASKNPLMKGVRLEVRAQKKRADARFVCLDSMLGNDWAMFYVIVGGRMTGR